MSDHLSLIDNAAESNSDTRGESGFPNLAEEVTNLEAKRLINDKVRAPSESNISPSLCMLRNWVADLQDAILNVDVSQRAEFGTLMAVMAGLGLKQTELAVSLGCDENTINRYVLGQAAPRSTAQRRGVLLETYRLLQARLNEGKLRVMRPHAVAAAKARAEEQAAANTANEKTGDSF